MFYYMKLFDYDTLNGVIADINTYTRPHQKNDMNYVRNETKRNLSLATT